ncbi:GNAT family N-acetyltransferase [Clostridium niameyense]|uniref:GNAT family N-acetyltransferase n=1 Tax=Clostridium niameyense TaxID=1622073 RepID=A0A6M0R611_9CLOT|nr:GNAT family N-acetyltransferase [Clostridium niameyense]NEZ45596.1 GNAT family N-acetyltransferase [Clostridium niameyense]
MNDKYYIKELKKEQWRKWDQFVMETEYSTPFSNTWFLERICKIFGGNITIIAIINKKKDKIVGGVALRSLEFFSYKIAFPSQLLLYMPILIDKKEVNDREVYGLEEKLSAILKKRFNTILYLNNTTDFIDLRGFKDNKFKLKVGYTAITDFSYLDFYNVGKSNRKLIKKAESNGLFIKESSDIDAMWNIWQKTAERQSFKLKLNKDNFSELYNVLKEHNCCQGFIVYTQDEKPVSFRISIWNNKSMAFGWIAGTDPEYFDIGASTYMIWNSLNLLKNKGFVAFDWCGANIKGVANFKMSFGARIQPYFYIDKYNVLFNIAIKTRKLYKKLCR